MTYQEIYDAALRMICESTNSEENADYEERAPYILATFCNECAPIEVAYCKAHKILPPNIAPLVRIAMIDTFPLNARFSAAVVYYLCAMLVIDENEALSDKFFSLYTDAVSLVQASIEKAEQSSSAQSGSNSGTDTPSESPTQCTLEKIVNRYPFF